MGNPPFLFFVIELIYNWIRIKNMGIVLLPFLVINVPLFMFLAMRTYVDRKKYQEMREYGVWSRSFKMFVFGALVSYTIAALYSRELVLGLNYDDYGGIVWLGTASAVAYLNIIVSVIISKRSKEAAIAMDISAMLLLAPIPVVIFVYISMLTVTILLNW